MADGHRRITVQQQQRHRLPDDVAASGDDGGPACNRDLLPIEQLDNPRWRACDENRSFLHQTPDVDRRQAVHVLLRRDRVEYAPSGPRSPRLRQRRLNEDAVMTIAAIEPFDERDGFRNRGGRRQAFEVRSKADFSTGLALVANVHFYRGVVADKHDAEPGWPAVLRREGRDLRTNLFLHRLRERLTIE